MQPIWHKIWPTPKTLPCSPAQAHTHGPGTAPLGNHYRPLITLSIACGHLDILRHLYDEVIVPQEVAAEITAGGMQRPGVAEFPAAQASLKPVLAPCAIAASGD